MRLGETRIAPGAHSAWHHHGKRTLYGFVAVGELTLEYGPGGREEVRPTAGEFLQIPPGLVHRDVNHGRVETVVVNILQGEGPATIDVDGPDP
ncbi:MAG: cupin domain-containing protein [Thermoplasmata archaeon]